MSNANVDSQPRVLIAEDHATVAAAIGRLLEKRCRVLGTVQDGEELVLAAARLKPEVVVVDLSMPLLGGLEAAKQLQVMNKDLRFVFLTMNHDPVVAASALSMGTVGYVLKHSAFSELPKAIESVLGGRAYVSMALRHEPMTSKALLPVRRVRSYGKPRVLLADDHPLLLDRVSHHLRQHFDIVGIAHNGTELISEVRRLQPELIVTDITMPGLTGIEAARELRLDGSLIPLVFLSVHKEEAFVQACFAEGAIGYVHKARLISDLIPAMKDALSGRRFISPSVSYSAERTVSTSLNENDSARSKAIS